MRRRTVSRTIVEPIDNWLESNDLHRKQVPRDASCLFRAVAEQICFSQSYHEKLRNLAVDYILFHKSHFQSYLEESVESYADKMRSTLEWASKLELIALALIFKMDFLIFMEIGAPPVNVTNFNFPIKKMLYKDPGSHYDIVYPKERITTAGFCQSLVYHILYSQVFNMANVNGVVDQMLHEANDLRKDSVNSEGQEIDIFRIVQQVTESFKTPGNNSSNIEISTPERGLTPPFPYRIAKALDPNIYRNSEYDTFIAMKREARFGPYDPNGLQIGVKVLIRTNKLSKHSKAEDLFHGYIQQMTEHQGPVEVFAEELGKKITVPYDCVEKYQVPSTAKAFLQDKSLFIGSPPTYRMLSTITKKANLPIPDNFNSPARGGKVKKKHLTTHSMPSPIRLPEIAKDKNNNNYNDADGEEEDNLSPDWRKSGSSARFSTISSTTSTAASDEDVGPAKPVCDTPPSTTSVDNGIDQRLGAPIPVPINPATILPCSDPYCSANYGAAALVATTPYGEVYGFPVDNCCYVPFSWPYYSSSPAVPEFQYIPVENPGGMYNPNFYSGP